MTLSNVGKIMELVAHPYISVRINGTTTLENVSALVKLNPCLPSDPTTSLLGVYLREVSVYVHQQEYIRMSRTVLFIIAKNWKHSNANEQ